LFLALVAKDHRHLPTRPLPFVELAEKRLAAAALKDECAGLKGAHRTAEAGKREILLRVVCGGSLKNADVRTCHLRIHRYQKVSGTPVVPHRRLHRRLG